jgi:lysophospholipase L1-like esterase
MAGHVLLAGDSIFDNGVYVPGQPDVAEQLRGELGPGWRVTLAAVDGAVCEDAVRQLADCPDGPTHIVVSAGGNDILRRAALLEQRVGSVADALALLKQAVDSFAPSHLRLVRAAQHLARPVAICTVYDANLGEVAAAGIALFNDAITRHVHAAGLDLVDLRLVCSEARDYANPIEPSAVGGAKIAAAIARFARATREPAARTRVFL